MEVVIVIKKSAHDKNSKWECNLIIKNFHRNSVSVVAGKNDDSKQISRNVNYDGKNLMSTLPHQYFLNIDFVH